MIYDKYFIGEAPIMSPHLLPDGAFSYLRDANLEDGSIKPWACPEKVCDVDFHAGTIIDYETCCVSEDPFDFVRYRHHGLDIYIRNNGGKLEVSEEPCGEWCDLCVPCPSGRLQVEHSGELGCDPEPVSYVYTYVHQLGFEGPPSKPTNVELKPEGPTTLTGLTAPSSECIDRIRIYRLGTPSSGGQGTLNVDGGFFLLAEIAATETEYVDEKGIGDTGALLMSEASAPAPRVDGVSVLSNGALVAHKGNRLVFSDPTDFRPQPHAFSGDYDMVLDSDIVAHIVDGERLYVVKQNGISVITENSANVVDTAMVYVETKITGAPRILTADSLRHTSTGVGYISSEGLIHVNQSGWVNITSQTFGRRKWREMAISDHIQIGGRTILVGAETYIVWHNNGGEAVPKEFTPTSRLTLIGRPRDMVEDFDGNLIYTADDGLYKFTFEPGDEEDCCPYEGVSRVHRNKSRVNYGAMKIEADGPIDFTLTSISCGTHTEVAEKLQVCGQRRLPMCGSATDYYYRVSGCHTITGIHVAISFEDTASA